MDKAQAGGVQSVERALALLRLVAGSKTPLSLAEITESAGLNRTTAWRLLGALESEGFVERDESSKEYRPGVAAATLCAAGHSRYAPYVRACCPLLGALRGQSRETIMLSVPHKDGLLCIDQMNSPQVVRLKNYENTLSPLYCTSNGKVLLGFMGEAEREAALQGPLEKLTPHTITAPAAIQKEVLKTQKQGYGMVLGEFDESENGISAPVLQAGRPRLFVTISGPGFRFTKPEMLALVPGLLKTCAELSALLWPGEP